MVTISYYLSGKRIYVSICNAIDTLRSGSRCTKCEAEHLTPWNAQSRPQAHRTQCPRASALLDEMMVFTHYSHTYFSPGLGSPQTYLEHKNTSSRHYKHLITSCHIMVHSMTLTINIISQKLYITVFGTVFDLVLQLTCSVSGDCPCYNYLLTRRRGKKKLSEG